VVSHVDLLLLIFENPFPSRPRILHSAGTNIKVQIEEFSSEGKKLVLSMSFENRADVGALSGISSSKWLNGVVQSVSPFGIFVRPAGYEMTGYLIYCCLSIDRESCRNTVIYSNLSYRLKLLVRPNSVLLNNSISNSFSIPGLVHQSRIPRDLISALKRRAPIAPGGNKTDIEALFTVGDVVRVRTQEVSEANRRLELSMLAFKNDADDDDDYVVEGRDPEGEEDKFAAQDADDEEETETFDAESTLIWWRGAPYVKIAGESSGPKVDEDFQVLDESIKIVEGTWRRMFEVDLREDEQDFNSKAMEAEMKELEEEIGELGGMDDDMIDCVGFGSSTHTQRVGSFVSMSSLPAEVSMCPPSSPYL
jgi:hypothetical protein